MFGDKAFGRHKGKWINACEALEKHIGWMEPSRLDITVEEKSLVCLHRYNKEDFDFNFETEAYVIDFEAATWSRYRDDKPYSYSGLKTNGDCS